MPMIVVHLILQLLLEITANAASTVKFSSFKGRVINSDIRIQTVTVRSVSDCLRTVCAAELSTCAVSFHKPTGGCVLSAMTAHCIAQHPNRTTSVVKDSGWSTYLPSHLPHPQPGQPPCFETPLEPPSALWMMDVGNKGRNLGTKGAALDMNEVGLTAWNVQGPRGKASNKTFVRLDAANRATMSNKHSGACVLSFMGSFTMAAWVKTDNISGGGFPILEGVPNGQDFWFGGTQVAAIYFEVGAGHFYVSQSDAKGKLFWRHIAAVYGGSNNTQIYINGTSVTLYKTVKNVQNYQIDSYNFAHNSGYTPNLLGSIACVTIYERALSRSEVIKLMNACP